MDFKRIEVVSDENFKKRMASLLDPRGVFQLVHRSKHGQIISIEEFKNLVTNQGKNHILDVAFNAGTNGDYHYFAIFAGAFTAAATSTYAGGGGGTESAGYDETLRQQWSPGAAASQEVSNSTAATITATGSLSVTGIGLVTSPGNNSGITAPQNTACSDGVLVSESAVTKSLSAAETLDITYTLSC